MYREEYTTRLLCPCCSEGVIKMDSEEEKYSYLHHRTLTFPSVSMPYCNNCRTRFVVEFRKDLKIVLKPETTG